jgi:hypothetical protein
MGRVGTPSDLVQLIVRFSPGPAARWRNLPLTGLPSA